MSVQSTVTFTNAVPASRPTYDTATIATMFKAAAYYLNSFIQGGGTLDYRVTFDDTVATANGASATSFQVGVLPSGGRLFEGSAEAEWKRGSDVNGATSDANIVVGGAVSNYFFDKTLASSADIPANARDFFSSMVHETLHALGFNSFADNVADKLTYGQFITQVGNDFFFNGSNAVAAFGGPVPLAQDNSHSHLGNSAAPNSNPAALVGGFIDTLTSQGIRDHFTATELGVLKDLGYTVAATQQAVAGTAGFDVISVAGPSSNYILDQTFDLTWLLDKAPTISYARLVGANVEYLQFSDIAVPVSDTGRATLASLNADYARVTRLDASLAAASQGQLAIQVDSGGTTLAAAAAQNAHRADGTTSVATLSYQFFTGKAPSAAGIDYLVSPSGPNSNNLNAAYYQSFNLENRYINFAVNLGKLGEGQAAFSAKYGAMSTFEAAKAAFAIIFGAPTTDQHMHDILDAQLLLNGQTFTRTQYLATYGGDGLEGIGTKAAIVGYLLTEAVKADLGTYAKSNGAFLADIGLNNAPLGVDLVGVYGKASYAYAG